MSKAVWAEEISAEERSRLLSDPHSELRYTVSGHELIVYHALDDRQFFWLAKELGYKQWSDTLHLVLEALHRDEPVYSLYFKKKRSGGHRRIHVPMDSLKDVQRRVLDNILTLYHVSKSAFGYSGGSVYDAIRPHLEAGNQTLLSTDIEDAFGSVCFEDVFQVLYGLPISDSYKGHQDKGYLSWEAAFALCRIVTCGRRLPQGAPSSPRLFDMVFLKLDRKLEHLAKNVGGVYTRFADNIYFSMPQSQFPEVVARAVIRTIHENRHSRYSYGLMDAQRFRCHKTCTRPLGTEAIRVLGVNVAGGEIHPTRQFKRRIRLSIHRMNWLLNNTSEDTEEVLKCWGILQGQMSFASQAVLPESLWDEYEAVKNAYEEFFFGQAPDNQ